MVMDGKAVEVSISQLRVRLSRPTARRTELTTPYWGLKMLRKIIPMAAFEMMFGIMYAVRTNFQPRGFLYSASASSTPIETWRMQWMRIQTTVWVHASANTGSWNRSI